MKQTAVEWLVEQLIPKAMATYDPTTYNAIKKAKEMEKEQMVDATVQYLIKHRGMQSEQSILTAVELSEQYYNETYNTDKK